MRLLRDSEQPAVGDARIGNRHASARSSKARSRIALRDAIAVKYGPKGNTRMSERKERGELVAAFGGKSAGGDSWSCEVSF